MSLLLALIAIIFAGRLILKNITPVSVAVDRDCAAAYRAF